MPRRTKIVSTLGPATDDPKIVDRLIDAGVDVVRINLSHGTHEEHASRAEHVRNRARAYGRQVGVLVDLQGPKIRTGKFRDGPVKLFEGDEFIIDVEHAIDAGNRERVGCTYKELPQDLERGNKLLVNDGKIVLWVEGVDGSEIRCKIKVGGELSDNKGINKYGGGLSAPALTDKDKADIRFAAEIDADYLAISFVRSAEDIHSARKLLTEAGGSASIVAKVERAEALEVIDEIIAATDVIMVVNFQPQYNAVTLLSIPRTTVAYIPGWQMEKVNKAYQHGQESYYPGLGPALVADTLLYNFGIEIDRYMLVDFGQFETIIDTLGGLELPLREFMLMVREEVGR